MRTVSIKGVEYNLRYTLRALFIYEELKGEPYSGAKIINNYILLFSMLLANNKDFSLSFNEVIEACDDNPSIFQWLGMIRIKKKRRKPKRDKCHKTI